VSCAYDTGTDSTRREGKPKCQVPGRESPVGSPPRAGKRTPGRGGTRDQGFGAGASPTARHGAICRPAKNAAGESRVTHVRIVREICLREVDAIRDIADQPVRVEA